MVREGFFVGQPRCDDGRACQPKSMHRATRNNQYAFEVNSLAEKTDVREAVESLFDVKVVKVRTQNRKGKPRRYRFTYGRTKSWKKAIVTLDTEDRIDFF